jgi:hypothetical protein
MPEKQVRKSKKNKTSFPPGVSGNPKGRPPKTDALAQAVRDFLEAPDPVSKRERNIELLHIAYGEAKKKRGRYKLQAIDLLWRRGYGKEPQPITGEGGKPLELKIVIASDFVDDVDGSK